VLLAAKTQHWSHELSALGEFLVKNEILLIDGVMTSYK
jgi:hypothetical protein